VNVKENVRKERKTEMEIADPTVILRLHRAIRIEDIAKGNAQIFHEIFRGSSNRKILNQI